MSQISIRNRLSGMVREITSDKVKIGDPIDAIIKATHVSVERP